jgi:hypothetical protein
VEPSIKARKRFFLKKEAKTFAHKAIRRCHRKPLIAKVFWFFFQKRTLSSRFEGLGTPVIMG